MSHSQVLSRLSPYLEGELDPKERARLDEHLRGCADCARALSELRTTVALLRDLPDPEPPSIAPAVMARIENGEAQPARWSRLLSATRPALAPLLAAAAGLAGFLLLTEVHWVGGPEPAGAPLRLAREAPGAAAPAAESPPPARSTAPTDVARSAAPAEAAPRSPVQSAIPEVAFADGASRRPGPRSRAVAPRAAAFGRATPFDLGLARVDRELDELLVAPELVLDELAGLPPAERRVRVDGLARRARQIQVSEAVVARIREAEHPLAQGVADRFEGVLSAESTLGR